jgi:16S rRNA (cytosine1402-N4)-methyltransferase
MEADNQKPKRRPRYKGTHPKSFKEKYKEHKPELYSEDVEKIVAKGRTPAGMHLSICVKEIMEILQVIPGQTGLDATLGYGGHSFEILKCLRPGGRLFAMDVDPYELPKTKERLASLGYGEEIFFPRQLNFSNMDLIVAESGPLDFVLADLGLSSMQIDNPERGFSLKVEGPLDLRLDPFHGEPASVYLKNISREKLEEIFFENGDEPFSAIIAEAIIKNRSMGMPAETTLQLKKIITEALQKEAPGLSNDDIKKSLQRCFQSIRIEVNHELDALDTFLMKLPDSLVSGGRAAILSFHSGEDRRVKKSFQYFFREGIYKEIAPGPVRASAEECFRNSRARAAKLRWAVKA